MVAYNLKYKGRFLDSYNQVCEVEIRQRNYNGSVFDLEFGESPVVITRPTKEITDTILSMGCKLRVWSSKNFEYAGLFNTAEKENMIVIKMDSNVLFRGFIEPELYEEEFMSPPYVVTIPAVDGLNSLEDYSPAIASQAGKMDLLSIIKDCLAETGLNLPVNVCCSLFSAQMHSVDDNKTLFEQTFVDLEGLKDLEEGKYQIKNAKDVLENVLKPFQCRVFQANDTWYIERLKNKSYDSVSWVRFEVDGSVSVVKSGQQYPVVIGQDDVYFYSIPSLQMDAGYGLQTINVDQKKYDSLIFNNFMAGISFEAIPQMAPLNRWFKGEGNLTVTPFENQMGINNGVKISHNGIQNGTIHVFQRTMCYYDKGDTVSISFKFTVKPGSKNPGKLQTYFDVWFNMYTYLNLDGSLSTYSGGGEASIRKEFSVEEDWKGDLTKAIEFSITTKPLAGGWLLEYQPSIVIIFRPFRGGNGDNSFENIEETYIGDIKVKINEEKEIDNTFVGTVNKTFKRKAPSIDIKFYDLPRETNVINKTYTNWNYANGLLNPWHGGIHAWYDKLVDAPSSPFTLVEKLLKDNFDQYYDTRDKISGEIITGRLIEPFNLVKINGRNGKKYMITGSEFFPRENKYKIDMEEIKGETVVLD